MIFLDKTPTVQTTSKRKSTSWTTTNLKISGQQNRQSTKWKGSVKDERKCLQIMHWIRKKKLQQSDLKNYNSLIKKWAEKLQRHFFSRKQWNGQQVQEKMLNITNQQGNANQITMCHFTPVRMAIIKKTRDNKCQQGCGEKGTLRYHWWNWEVVQQLWQTEWRFLSKLKIEIS